MRDGKIAACGTMDELRSIYRSTIHVKIKHFPVPKSEQLNLHQWLESAGTDLEIKETYLRLTVKSEKKIAEIIRAIQQCKADVLRVEVEEPTLEDIFLDG